MKYSKLFGKTNKLSKEFDSKNASLLIKGGFIDQLIAGAYNYLPLGNRVLRKIENIIREEMDKVASEILMPALSPRENWEKTNRLDKVDVLFQVEGANEHSRKKNPTKYILNSTHEEVVTPLVKKFNLSYKDLPTCVYQIQNKFRNEGRPKSGILRGREFGMKDAYSFHVSEEDLMEYYETMKEVYTKIFKRLGLGEKTVIALASGGDFTENYSHEFQTICETGEDVLFKDHKSGIIYNREVTPSKAPSIDDENEEEKALEDVLGEGLIGVAELSRFLNIPVEKTTKTLLFKNENGEVIAAAVRGGYDVDEEKLKKILGCKTLEFADQDTVRRVTGAEPGYAGILNLPEEVKLIIDESVVGRKNFETGANKTNYHTINVNFGRDIKHPDQVYDIKVAREGDLNPESGEKYEILKTSEVGNIFPLNTKFTKAFDYKFMDKDGKEKIVYMGCYGIGPTRLMGVIAEVYNDENGLVWPKQVAPYMIHLVTLGNDEEVLQIAENLHNELEERNIEVLWDDRNSGPGEKLSDADLIGIPIRAVLSKRSLENGGVEVKLRDQKESQIVAVDQLDSFVTHYKI